MTPIMKSKKEQPLIEQIERPAQRGIYLLPNLFTTAALFAGFYAIIAAIKGHFDTAALAIFVAMVADNLDGRIARLTNTQTAFGAQYDSLSDMVAFGIAPALMIYSWAFFAIGKVGWFAAFLYVAAVALRLARFNTRVADKRYFQGLPSPAAAGLLASAVWVIASHDISGPMIALPLAALTIAVAASMVSGVCYFSFKEIDFKGKVPFVTIVLAAIVIAAIALQPPEILFALFALYFLSGPIVTLWQRRQLRKSRS